MDGLTLSQKAFLSAFVLDAKEPPAKSEPSDDPERDRESARRAFGLWQDAWSLAEDRMGVLQSAMVAHDDERYGDLVEAGFFGSGWDEAEALDDALERLVKGTGSPGEVASGLRGVAEWLKTEELVELIDENPLGIQVGLRANLAPSLKQIAAVVAEAKKGK